MRGQIYSLERAQRLEHTRVECDGLDVALEWPTMCLPTIGLALMANSSNGDGIFKELLGVLLKDTSTPWQWEGYLPFNS